MFSCFFTKIFPEEFYEKVQQNNLTSWAWAFKNHATNEWSKQRYVQTLNDDEIDDEILNHSTFTTEFSAQTSAKKPNLIFHKKSYELNVVA